MDVTNRHTSKLRRSGINTALSYGSMLKKCGITHTVRALGVNHHELYFHETPREIIRNAFAGEHGPFFRTFERDN